MPKSPDRRKVRICIFPGALYFLESSIRIDRIYGSRVLRLPLDYQRLDYEKSRARDREVPPFRCITDTSATNTGAGLVNVSRETGPAFSRQLSGRGLALGDFDNDGALDVLISTNDGATVFLKNNVGSKNHWLGLNLVGKSCTRDAVGARITWQSGDLKRSTMKIGGGSYLSSHDPRIVLGIGSRSKLDWLEVKWPKPSTVVQRYTDLPVDRYISISEGEAKWK